MRTYLQALKARVAPLENPYLRALADGSFEREDFIETQIQFLHAVVYFSRPMAVLATGVSPSTAVGAILFLLSELSGYVTGQTLHVNGGMAMI